MILWQRLDQPGHEAARLTFHGSEWRLTGTAVFASDGRPCRLDYLVVCAADWRTRSGRVTGWLGTDLVEEVDAIITSEDIYPKVDRDHARTMKTPTLLMKGEKNKTDARALWLVMDELERLVAEGSRTVAIIPGAGHGMWWDNPKACRQSLLDVLKGK